MKTNTYKKRIAIVLGIVLQIVQVTGCSQLLNTKLVMKYESELELPTNQSTENYELTYNDYETTYLDAFEINFENIDTANTDYYSFENNTLTIFTAGNYILNGNMTDGNIVVDVYDDEIVHFFLNNVQIASRNAPAIYVDSANKVILTALEGTENHLSDNARHAQETNACVFSNVDLTINGHGKLNVFGYHEDGIRTKDQLKVVNATVSVKSKGDGLRGNDGIILQDSNVEIESEKNALYSDSTKDIIALQGGTCKIVAGENAIHATTKVVIKNITINLYSILEAIECNGIQEIEEGCINDQ